MSRIHCIIPIRHTVTVIHKVFRISISSTRYDGKSMTKRRLGNSDLEITPIGVGAWAIGGSGWQFAWGPQDDNDSIAAIHAALDAGLNWIDTAAIYGMGHSEEIVGKAIAGQTQSSVRLYEMRTALESGRLNLWIAKGRLHPKGMRGQPAPPEPGHHRSVSNPLAAARRRHRRRLDRNGQAAKRRQSPAGSGSPTSMWSR